MGSNGTRPKRPSVVRWRLTPMLRRWFILGTLIDATRNTQRPRRPCKQHSSSMIRWQGHFTLGRVYLELRNLIKAGHHVGRTIQLRPEYADAHLLGGNILMQAGLAKNALIEYEEYLRLEPKGQFADQTRAIVDRIK